MAEMLHTKSLIVLLLLSTENKAYMSIVHHKRYRLFTRSGIERHTASTNAPGAKVGEDILQGVL